MDNALWIDKVEEKRAGLDDKLKACGLFRTGTCFSLGTTERKELYASCEEENISLSKWMMAAAAHIIILLSFRQ